MRTHDMLVPYVENVTYVTYILDMVAIVNYNFVLPEDLCDLHTGHGSDRELQLMLSEGIAHAQWPESVTHYQKIGKI